MNKFLNFIKFIPNFPIFSASNEKSPPGFMSPDRLGFTPCGLGDLRFPLVL